jgi:uroporphyrinogen decarboxylase
LRDLTGEEYPTLYRKGRNADEFGTVWQGERLGLCGIPVDWPIKDLSRYDEYPWPEVFAAGPPKGRLYSGHMAGYDGRWYARGAWFTYFEQLQQLRGMENLLMDMAPESPLFYRLLDDLLDFNLRWIDKWNQLEYDGFEFADDWGGQRGMMVNPQTWRRIFKPRYREMFKRVRAEGKHVWYPVDGRVNEILPEFIELGADVINCQVYVVGHNWISANLRGKVAIRTDLDCQHLLPFGSPSQIKEEVHRTFEVCGTPDGGLIACGEIGPDVPLENIRALYEGFVEYGAYAR